MLYSSCLEMEQNNYCFYCFTVFFVRFYNLPMFSQENLRESNSLFNFSRIKSKLLSSSKKMALDLSNYLQVHCCILWVSDLNYLQFLPCREKRKILSKMHHTEDKKQITTLHFVIFFSCSSCSISCRHCILNTLMIQLVLKTAEKQTLQTANWCLWLSQKHILNFFVAIVKKWERKLYCY